MAVVFFSPVFYLLSPFPFVVVVVRLPVTARWVLVVCGCRVPAPILVSQVAAVCRVPTVLAIPPVV